MITATKCLANERTLRSRFRIIYDESGAGHLRFRLLSFLIQLLGDGTGGRLRSTIYRVLGLSVQPETLIMGTIAFGEPAKAAAHFRIGSGCFINRFLYVDSAAPVTLGNRVYVG